MIITGQAVQFIGEVMACAGLYESTEKPSSPGAGGTGAGRGRQHPETAEQFHLVHRCLSAGRDCQNHFIGTDFEAQFWPSRKECHSLLAIPSWVPWGR